MVTKYKNYIYCFSSELRLNACVMALAITKNGYALEGDRQGRNCIRLAMDWLVV